MIVCGGHIYDKVRTSYYCAIDLIVLCFSVDDENGWKEKEFWMKEIRKNSPKTPIFLVATKIDLTSKIFLKEMKIWSERQENIVSFSSLSSNNKKGIKLLTENLQIFLQQNTKEKMQKKECKIN